MKHLGPRPPRERDPQRPRGRGTIWAVRLGLPVFLVVGILILPRLSGTGSKAGPFRVSGHVGSAVELTATAGCRALPPSTTAEQVVASAETSFALSFLRSSEASASGTADVVEAPLSLAEALTMLGTGAGGRTEAEIEQALGWSGRSTGDQGQGWQALRADLLAPAGGVVTVDDATSLWTRQGLSPAVPFLSGLKCSFGAGLWEADFAAHPDQARAAINAWADQVTAGRIPTLIGPADLDADTFFVLVDAAFFRAPWSTPFSPDTPTGSFTTASGPIEQVPFLSLDEPLQIQASLTPGADLVELPYGGGRYVADVLMPVGTPLPDFVARLTDATWAGLLGGLRATSTKVTMPVLHLQATTDLQDDLTTLGMPTMFGLGADFSPITTTPIQITKAVQDTTLDVTASGTEASGATGFVGGLLARYPTVTVDHPYLFFVRDTVTGAILFDAAVSAPWRGAASRDPRPTFRTR